MTLLVFLRLAAEIFGLGLIIMLMVVTAGGESIAARRSGPAGESD